MRVLSIFLALALGGGVLGLAVNAVRSDGLQLTRTVSTQAAASTEECVAPTGQPRIDADQALQLHRATTAAFADVRSSDLYTSGHIAEAVHLPCSSQDVPDWLAGIPGNETVVIYGSEGDAELVAQALTASGYADVRVLEGGFQAWLDAEGPSQGGACGACQ